MTKRATPLVVFDLDGVLIDSAEANVQAFTYGLEQVGIERPSPQAVLDLVGIPARRMLAELGCPDDLTDQVFSDHVRPHYIEHLPALARAYPNARQVLEELLSRGYRIAACTSGDRQTQTAALEAIGLLDLIEEMQTPCDSQFGKPDPRYLKEILAKFEPFDELHHVEDSEVGILMGRDCGAVTYYASYGNGSLTGLVEPSLTIASITELPDAILKGCKR